MADLQVVRDKAARDPQFREQLLGQPKKTVKQLGWDFSKEERELLKSEGEQYRSLIQKGDANGVWRLAQSKGVRRAQPDKRSMSKASLEEQDPEQIDCTTELCCCCCCCCC